MDWEVSNTTLACAACTKGFAEEQAVFSALFDETPNFVRRDFCAECWPGQDHDKAFSYWQTRIPKKDAPVRRFVDDEVILDFFKKLEGQEEPSKKSFRYVLGLLLMRKKALKFTEFRRGETSGILVLYDKVRDTSYEVADPNLTEEQIQQVTEEIGQVLNAKV